MRAGVLATWAIAAIHSEHVQIRETQEPSQRQRPNTDRASSGDCPFTRRQNPEPFLVRVEYVPELEVGQSIQLCDRADQRQCDALKLSRVQHKTCERRNTSSRI